MNPNSKFVSPVTPNALRLEQALQRSEPLARLALLMRDSNARFNAIRHALPASLAAHVKPGPVDEQGWSVLAENASVAAKLRQLQPRLETILQQGGWDVATIRGQSPEQLTGTRTKRGEGLDSCELSET